MKRKIWIILLIVVVIAMFYPFLFWKIEYNLQRLVYFSFKTIFEIVR